MNYSIYRCLDPIKQDTNKPWYPISNVCPCNPNDYNISGRGYTPCAFGVQYESKTQINLSNEKKLPNQQPPLVGSLIGSNQFVAPQLEPRMLTRIGNQWRSGF